MQQRSTEQSAERPPPDSHPDWRAEAILKRDMFGSIEFGRYRGEVGLQRNVGDAALWATPTARLLFANEVRALRRCEGLDGVPQLLGRAPGRLYRTWIDGRPLQIAKPYRNAAFFASAKSLLRALHRRGVAHNDLAKQQNWLQRADGTAAVIDFQLATVHRRRGKLFRLLAYEDIRHLLKQKRFYCRRSLTAAERRVLARRQILGRLWHAVWKRSYNFLTRRILHWRDNEGMGHRLERFAGPLAARLIAHPLVREAAVAAFRTRGATTGLYAFVAAAGELSPATVKQWAREALGPEAEPDFVQIVQSLPRDRAGQVRQDFLDLVAGNRVLEASDLAMREPSLAQAMSILENRLNLADRHYLP
jgi:hypothetical protein